jgi:hypothetical protein
VQVDSALPHSCFQVVDQGVRGLSSLIEQNCPYRAVQQLQNCLTMGGHGGLNILPQKSWNGNKLSAIHMQ